MFNVEYVFNLRENGYYVERMQPRCTEVGYGIFSGCSKLTNAYCAFWQMDNCELIKFSDENDTPQSRMFYNCKALTKATYLFKNCGQRPLNKATYKPRTIIKPNIFKDTQISNFFEMFAWSDNIKIIEDNAFAGNQYMTTCENIFHNCANIETIGNNIFKNCTNLENANKAFYFYEYRNREDIKIKTIGYGIFSGCVNLKSVSHAFRGMLTCKDFKTEYNNVPENDVFYNCRSIVNMRETFRSLGDYKPITTPLSARLMAYSPNITDAYGLLFGIHIPNQTIQLELNGTPIHKNPARISKIRDKQIYYNQPELAPFNG